VRSPRKSGSTPNDKEIRAILARKERKGLTYAQVSRETGIPVGTLTSWANRLRKKPKPPKETSAIPSPSSFVEVLFSGDEASRGDSSFELQLPQGLLRIPPGFHPPSLRALLQILLQEGSC